jgi:hypothetical protein
MSRQVRTLTWTLLGMGFLIVAVAALYYANEWWQSGIMTVSILGWLGGVLAALYSSPERRPFVVGAVVAALLYVLLALGPWFRGNVGPWLLTSQSLAHVETKWLARQPPPTSQQLWTSYPVLLDSSWPAGYVANPAGSTAISLPLAPPLSRFAETGHWLCGWLAAAVGGWAALWMAGSHRRHFPNEETIA